LNLKTRWLKKDTLVILSRFYSAIVDRTAIADGLNPLTISQTDLSAKFDSMSSQWQGASGGLAMDKMLTVQAPFDVTGLNQPATLYLNEAYAVPVQECWTVPIFIPPFVIPVCYLRSTDKTGDDTNHIDMSGSIKWDVLPTRLDKFYAPLPRGDGFGLAWGGVALPFPRVKDFDGDGLLSKAYGGMDQDDVVLVPWSSAMVRLRNR
jgi:hypothetical protein